MGPVSGLNLCHDLTLSIVDLSHPHGLFLYAEFETEIGFLWGLQALWVNSHSNTHNPLSEDSFNQWVLQFFFCPTNRLCKRTPMHTPSSLGPMLTRATVSVEITWSNFPPTVSGLPLMITHVLLCLFIRTKWSTTKFQLHCSAVQTHERYTFFFPVPNTLGIDKKTQGLRICGARSRCGENFSFWFQFLSRRSFPIERWHCPARRNC